MPPSGSSPVRGVKQTGGATVVSLGGDVDMHRASELRDALTKIVAPRPPQLVLDLSEVKFLDSTGLGTLVYFLKEVGGYDGKMLLANLNENVRNVLEITRLEKVFSVFPSVEEAIRSFGDASSQQTRASASEARRT